MALLLSCAFNFNFRIDRKHALYRFCEGNREFMQDIGGKEDTRVEHKDLALAGDSYMSNPLDTVSPLEISLHP